jgi:hypothetical protein
MKVKFGILKGLDGKELKNNNEPLYIGKSLANVIANETSKDNTSMQKYELAIKLFNANDFEIEISESEKEIIKSAVNSGSMSILIAAQILTAINNAKD